MAQLIPLVPFDLQLKIKMTTASYSRYITRKGTVIDDEERFNTFAIEPQMYIDPKIIKQMENNVYETHNEKAERLNGRLAMLGIIAALGAYAVTGQIIPGIW
jgi:hypothetical protein